MLHKGAVHSPINGLFLSLVKIWIETLIAGIKKKSFLAVLKCTDVHFVWDIPAFFRVFLEIYEALEGYNVQMLHPLEILPPSIFALVTD